MLAGFDIDGPHFGAAVAFDGSVLFFEFLKDGGIAGSEAFEGILFVDHVGWTTNEDRIAGECHAAGDDRDEAIPSMLDEAAR